VGAPVRRAALAGELAIVAVLVLCYDRIRGLAEVKRAVAVDNGLQLLTLEHHIGIDLELPSNLWLAAHRYLADMASWYYQVAHLTVTLGVLVVCYIRRPDVYRSARNALILINVVGLVIYWCYPVAPPRLLPGSAFVDVTKVTGVANAASTSAPNPYAAMPSLHTAWAVWVTVVALILVRVWWLRLVALLYPVLTVAVIVTTGNHYLLDTVAGAALAVGATAAVRCWPSLRQPEPT
jgi:membrane-associated phospholipid phosphatase